MSSLNIKSTIIIAGVFAAAILLGSIFFLTVDSRALFMPAEATKAEQIITKCKNDHDCVGNEIQTLALKEDKKMVLSVYQKLLDGYGDTDSYCHLIAHHLGMFIYGYTGSLQEAFSASKRECGGAAYHGIVQAYLAKENYLNDRDPSRLEIKDLCAQAATFQNYADKLECIHAIGHGLAAAYQYNVTLAVQRCDELASNLEQTTCGRGVFMENVDNFSENGKGDFKSDDIYFPCDAVDEKYAPSCYVYQSSYMLRKTTIEHIFDKCDQITPNEFVKYCYTGVGRQKSTSIFTKYENAIYTCQHGQSEYQPECYRGMAMVITDQKGIEEGMKFCMVISESAKERCYDAVGLWVHMIYSNDSDVSKMCSGAENTKYADICKASIVDKNGLAI